MEQILTAKDWIKKFGDDSVRVGEGLLDKPMTQVEFERAVEKEMGSIPQNIYRDSGLFAGEDSDRKKQVFADLKKIRKELVNTTPAERDELLEKAIEIKLPEPKARHPKDAKPKPQLPKKPRKKKVDKSEDVE